MKGSYSRLGSGWFTHLEAPSLSSKRIIGQTLQSWAVYIAVSSWYPFWGACVLLWDICMIYTIYFCTVNIDDLLQVAAISTLKLITCKSLRFWFWITNPLVAQSIFLNASLHVWNIVYIALGYTVDDTPILSPLKSPTTLATAPEQE